MVASTTGGRVMASGGGWAWLRDGECITHLTNLRGPRGPVTAIVDRVPATEPGDRIRLDATQAGIWSTPAMPPSARADAIAEACSALRPHAWNDPRALALGSDPLEESVRQLIGRGPGLTPAGDDALAGYLATRIHLGRPSTLRADLTMSIEATGEPSRTLLRAAVQGQVFAPVARMIAVILAADGPALAPTLRQLVSLGRTTGRAYLTGIVRAFAANDVHDG